MVKVMKTKQNGGYQGLERGKINKLFNEYRVSVLQDQSSENQRPETTHVAAEDIRVQGSKNRMPV